MATDLSREPCRRQRANRPCAGKYCKPVRGGDPVRCRQACPPRSSWTGSQQVGFAGVFVFGPLVPSAPPSPLLSSSPRLLVLCSSDLTCELASVAVFSERTCMFIRGPKAIRPVGDFGHLRRSTENNKSRVGSLRILVGVLSPTLHSAARRTQYHALDDRGRGNTCLVVVMSPIGGRYALSRLVFRSCSVYVGLYATQQHARVPGHHRIAPRCTSALRSGMYLVHIQATCLAHVGVGLLALCLDRQMGFGLLPFRHAFGLGARGG